MVISLNEIINKELESLKDDLFSQLRKDRPIVNKFIVVLLRQKRIEINTNSESDRSNLTINTENNRSIYKINWGIADDSLKTIDRELFDFNSFDNNTLKQYRLLQQICVCIYHELLTKNLNSFKSLLNTAETQFNLDKRFYTLYGSFHDSIEHSKNPMIVDIAELLSIYLWDGNYFNKFFRFLISVDLKDSSLKKAYGIRTLNIANAKIIEELLFNSLQVYNPELQELN